MATDAGDLLEQRPALLGSQGQRLVDHALADEQEGVVGEVGAVEQVDEVAQADALLVEQVLVLAAAVQPATELQDLEVDRQQAVAVVEDERDVGHALGGALLRAGPDDVLGLARAQRPTLLAERPAQGIGEVALARAVGPDDGRDPATELDVGPLGERLEALQTQRQEPRQPAGPRAAPSGSGRSGRSPRVGSRSSVMRPPPRPRSMADRGSRAARIASIATAAAAVSASRRDEPSPDAEQLAVDPDLDAERLLVVGTAGVDEPVLGPHRRTGAGCTPAADSWGS